MTNRKSMCDEAKGWKTYIIITFCPHNYISKMFWRFSMKERGSPLTWLSWLLMVSFWWNLLLILATQSRVRIKYSVGEEWQCNNKAASHCIDRILKVLKKWSDSRVVEVQKSILGHIIGITNGFDIYLGITNYDTHITLLASSYCYYRIFTLGHAWPILYNTNSVKIRFVHAPHCMICKLEKTPDHSLRKCTYTKSLWKEVGEAAPKYKL